MINCCNKPEVKDLTQGLGNDRHMYCTHCGAHEYDGRQYTRAEWNRLMELDKDGFLSIERYLDE